MATSSVVTTRALSAGWAPLAVAAPTPSVRVVRSARVSTTARAGRDLDGLIIGSPFLLGQNRARTRAVTAREPRAARPHPRLRHLSRPRSPDRFVRSLV